MVYNFVLNQLVEFLEVVFHVLGGGGGQLVGLQIVSWFQIECQILSIAGLRYHVFSLGSILPEGHSDGGR